MKHILNVLGLTVRIWPRSGAKFPRCIIWGALACWTLAFTGCVIPALTGIKEIENGPDTTTYRFMTGADFSIGLNGIDRVENNRGIKPKD